MMPHARRNVLRRYLVRPIEFSRRAHGRCHQGQMGDYSIHGMQFHSPVAMATGDPIWIRTEAVAGRRDANRPPAAIKAVVCWCSNDNETDIPGFLVGVTFYNGPSGPLHTAADQNKSGFRPLKRPQERK